MKNIVLKIILQLLAIYSNVKLLETLNTCAFQKQ